MYIARGHLAPNADFMTYAWQVLNIIIILIAIIIFIIIILIIATVMITIATMHGQDATFTFIDVAPQWQSFNAGKPLEFIIPGKHFKSVKLP